MRSGTPDREGKAVDEESPGASYDCELTPAGASLNA